MMNSSNDLFLVHPKSQSATKTSIDSSNENLSSSFDFDGSCTTRGGTGDRAILEQWNNFRTTLRKLQRQHAELGGGEYNETVRAASSAMAKQGAI